MKSQFFAFLFIFFSSVCSAQLDGYTNANEKLLSFSLNRVSLKNPTATTPNNQKFGPYYGLGFAVNYYNFNQGELRWGMDFKWVTDIFPELHDLLSNTYLLREKEPFLSGLWWSNLGINVWSNEYINIGVGGNIGDYLVEIPDVTLTEAVLPAGIEFPSQYQDPTGWYWELGPTFYFDAGYNHFFLSVTASYSISYWRPPIHDQDYESAINKIDGYPSPHFLYIDFTVNHHSGFFVSFNKTKLIDRGPNAYDFSRNELGIGWKL